MTEYDEWGEVIDPDEVVDLDGLDPAQDQVLDSLMFVIGRNAIAGNDKVRTVHKFRKLLGLPNRPTPATVEAYAIRAGKHPKVAKRLREVYAGVRDGKTYLDTSRRPI